VIVSIAGISNAPLNRGDLSNKLERGGEGQGFNVEAQLGSRMDLCTFTLMDEIPGVLAIPDRAEVVIYDAAAGADVIDPPNAISAYNTFRNGAGTEHTDVTAANWTPRLFAGYVATPKYTVEGPQRYVEITAQDYTFRLRTTVVNQAFSAGQTDRSIIQTLGQRYRSDFDYTNVQTVTASFPSISFPVHTFEQFMQRIVKISRAVYRVDYFKRMFYGLAGQLMAPINFSDQPTLGARNPTFENADPLDGTLPVYWGRSEVGNGTANWYSDNVIDGYFERGSLGKEQSVWDIPSGEYSYDSGAGPASGRGNALLCTTTRLTTGWNHAAAIGPLGPNAAIPVSPTKTYRFQGWMKVSAGAKHGHIKVSWWKDAALSLISSIRSLDACISYDNDGTPTALDWTHGSIDLQPPADANYCYIECMGGWWDGVTEANARFWFNGISFKPLVGVPELVLEGGASLALGQLATALDYGGLWTKNGIPVVAGQVLAISARVRATRAGAAGLNYGPFRFRLTFANVAVTAVQPSGLGGVNVVDTTYTPPDTNVHTMTATVTVPNGYTYVFVELYANPAVAPAFPFIIFVDKVLVASTYPTEDLEYTPDGSGLVNKVWVVGDTFLSNQQAYTIPPSLVNGTNFQFPLPGDPEPVGMTITVAGVDQGTIGVAPGDGDISTPSSLRYNTAIQHAPSTVTFKTPPGAGQTVIVTGKFRYPLVQTISDPALIAAAGGLVFEGVLRDKRIDDFQLARNVGQSYLQNQGQTLKGGQFKSKYRSDPATNAILQPGQLLSVKNDALFLGLLKDAGGNPTTTAVVVITKLETSLTDDVDQPYETMVSFADRTVFGGY
jgi:hypothetical protein